MNNNDKAFRLWVKACEEFHDDIYKLTNNKEDGHGIYETIKEYYPPGQYNTMREVMYHLWWHGKHEIVTKNVVELYWIWQTRTADNDNKID